MSLNRGLVDLMLPNLIVPTLTRYDLLQRLLDSVTFPVKHLLIIDNGNGLPDVDCQAADEVTVLRMPANLGVAGSWNLGVKSFPHDPFWAFASDDAYFLPGSLAQMSETGPDDIRLSKGAPHWQAFTVGENLIRRVGLWCEGFHPAYHEDTDWERRARAEDVTLKHVLDVGHNNSSTLKGSQQFQNRNRETYRVNQLLFEARKSGGVSDAGQWDLDRRRRLEWLR